MRLLKRNQRPVYYSLFNEETDEVVGGYKTGEKVLLYDAPIMSRMRVSAGKGDSGTTPFGVDVDYTRTLITDDMDCPVTETTLLWIDSTPVQADDNTVSPPYNYLVVGVAKSLNHITFAVREVTASDGKRVEFLPGGDTGGG